MSDKVGQQIGNYRLVRLLGSGGFAEVYLGQHVLLASKQAAIKILHLFDVDVKKFQQEAETTEQLVHPHIVRLLDFSLEEGMPFLVLDFAPGGSLRNRHPKGSQVPIDTVVGYLKEITPALQYAHDRNILHRDIKPDNVLIGRQGELLISDFGLAVLSQTGRTSLQASYGIGGTPFYMAPEAYRGKPEKGSDQYSLAIVVYEWLCGSVPFNEGGFIELGYQHTHEPVPPLREKNPSFSSDVEAVILTALAKDPGKRFGSVRAFANALEQACLPSQKAPPVVEPVPNQSPSAGIPTIQVTPPSIPVAPNTVDAASTQASSLPTTMPPLRPSQVPQLPQDIGAVHSPIEAASIPPSQPAATTSRKGFFKSKNVLLVALILLVIGGSVGILSSPVVKWIYPTTTRPTVTHPAASANAPMFGFNAQHTNFNPDEHILNVTNVSQLRQAWTYPGSFANPVVANSIVYLSSYDHNLYALNASTGALLWKVPIGNATSGPPAFNASVPSPAVVNGIVYVGSDDHNLYAFNASTGVLLWKASARGTIYSSLVVADGVIYADVDDNNLYAFNASTGSILWSVAVGTGGAASNPAVAQGIVYIGSTDRKLYAFKASTGAQLWAVPTDGFAGALWGSITASSPAVADGIVYVGSSNPSAGPAPGNLYAFNASTGALLWKVHVSNNNIEDTPAIANGIVYIGSEDFSLHALDAKTGAVKWATATQSNIHNSSPAVANGVVYISSWDQNTYAFNAQTGVILWKAFIGLSSDSSPVVVDGMVYISLNGDNHKLYAFHLVAKAFTLKQTSFNLPDDGTQNNNGYIGPFCCTGRTATVFTTDNHPVGYIYFYAWHGQAYNIDNSHSVAPDISILVSGLTDLSNLSSSQKQSSIDFMAGDMTPGASRSTQAGKLYFTVTIQRVTIQTLSNKPYFDMGSVAVKVRVSTSAP